MSFVDKVPVWPAAKGWLSLHIFDVIYWSGLAIIVILCGEFLILCQRLFVLFSQSMI
jgi:hypothetical protein